MFDQNMDYAVLFKMHKESDNGSIYAEEIDQISHIK